MKIQRFGDISVQKVLDGVENFKAVIAFPEIDLEVFNQHKNWVEPFYDFAKKTIRISMHSYVISTPEINILVDTCIGNGKNRVGNGPIYKANADVLSHWNLRESAYLQNLNNIGLRVEDIDYVMCTHLHADHVGWNTRLENNRWIPTFPNAKYLFSPDELASISQESNNPYDQYTKLVYEDSVLPVIEAGQSILIDNGLDLGKGIHLLPTPGHSPGHYCIEIESAKHKGILTGDILHNPIQVNYPGLSTMFCADKTQSNEQRIKLVDQLTDTETIVLAAHFCGSTAGRIISNNDSREFLLI